MPQSEERAPNQLSLLWLAAFHCLPGYSSGHERVDVPSAPWKGLKAFTLLTQHTGCKQCALAEMKGIL